MRKKGLRTNNNDVEFIYQTIMSMLESFQNTYWDAHPQKETFRHRQALKWVDASYGPVADIGCGDGFLLAKLKEKNVEAFGIDISSSGIASCKAKELEAEQVDFGSGALPSREIRTAILLDVLEHLFEPQKILGALHDRHTEVVIISVPNFASLPARLQVLLGRVPENNQPKKGHIYWFTYRVLRSLLQRTGWKIERIAVNTFWSRMPIIGSFMQWCANTWPGLFALSFVVMARRNTRPESSL